MELPQQFPSFLLLFHLLLPGVASYSLLTGRFKPSGDAIRLTTTFTSLALGLTSLLLLVCVTAFPQLQTSAGEIQCVIAIPGDFLRPGMMDQINWGISPPSALFLCLLPWLTLTIQLFQRRSETTSLQSGCHLLLLGSLGIFIASQDIGSLLSSGAMCILLISFLIARNGVEEKRSGAGLFLSIQMTGLLIFAAGLAMFLAGAAAVRSAPYGTPGISSSSIPGLVEIVQTAMAEHPAVLPLWEEYRLLPAGLTLLGIVIMAAGFPMQVWLSEVSASASLGERLWLLAWVKGVLFTGFRLLQEIDPVAFSLFSLWGLAISIFGALFVSSLLFSQAYLPRLQSSALAWTQQLAFMSAFAAMQPFPNWLTSILVCHLAGMVLLTIALTTLSERSQSVEISSFRGLMGRAPWMQGVLVSCMLMLTLTPLSLGFFQGWLTSTALLQADTTWSSVYRVCFVVANLLALAGLARVTQLLCTGPLRLPEMAPPLRERTSQGTSTISLEFSLGQKTVLIFWALLGILVGVLFPVVMIFLGSPEVAI